MGCVENSILKPTFLSYDSVYNGILAAKEADSIMFDPGIAVGSVLTEKQVHDTFECQTTFGIRMSKKNNLFVIMSGSAKVPVYSDWWEDDILYYNGMDNNSDENGNQTLNRGKGNNNSQLFQCWGADQSQRPQIFLFVKKIRDKCVYKGEVDPVKQPFRHPRHDDPSRTVWVFPLKLRSVDTRIEKERFIQQERLVFEYDAQTAREKAIARESIQPVEVPKEYRGVSTVFERDPYISAYAKMRASGCCDLCGAPSPFKDRSGRPYLEEHHVIWLSRGGRDSVRNVVALCPNCHRKMHVVDNPSDIAFLQSVVTKYENS